MDVLYVRVAMYKQLKEYENIMVNERCKKQEYLEQIYNIEQFSDGIVPKKWWLGDRNIEQMILPYTVHCLDSWAFAHCRNLRELWLPKRKLEAGEGVFDACNSLSQIVVYDLVDEDIRFYQEEAELLAYAVKFAPVNEVLNLMDIGTKQWYDWMDRQICRYLETPDDKGFEPFLAGGEEDYESPENHIEGYMFLRRQEKISILFARFRQERFLSEEKRKRYAVYMSEQEDALLSVILSKREEAYEYLELCETQGTITVENVDWLLGQMDDFCYTESRAYLLHLKEEMRKASDQSEIWKEWSL